MNRASIFILALTALLTVLFVGAAGSAEADSATQLSFPNGSKVWLAVDPSAQHVFVSGGPGTSSIAVLNYSGALVHTITGEGGASQMVLDSATHTLYVALHDATAISEINTQTLTETKRFSTVPYADPTSIVIAGGKLWFSCDDQGQDGCLVSANLDGTGMDNTAITGGSLPLFLAAGGTNNRYLAFGYSEDEPPNLYVYDVSGSMPALVKYSFDPNTSSDVADMTFDPTGANLLLASGAPYFIQSLTTTTLTSSAEYPTGPYPLAVAVTANGKFVAGGTNTGTGSGDDVFVYPVGNTTPVRTWSLGTGVPGLLPHSLAFTPDASRLFAVSNGSAGHVEFNVLSSPTVPLTATTTSLTRVTPSKGTVRYGSQASLKVQVNGAASGKVDLYATPTGGTKQLVGTGTLSSGTKTFSVKPTQNTTYSAQLEQGSTWASSASQDVSVNVAPVVSVSSRGRGKGRYKGHRVTKTQLNAKVNPARPGELVGIVVQRRANGHWRADVGGQVALASNGVAQVLFVTNRHAQFRFQATYPGDSYFVKSASAWKKFRVR